VKSEKKGKTLGTLGTILGLIALGSWLLHFTFGPIKEPEPIESFVADTTVKLKNAISAKLKGEEYSAPTIEKSLDYDEVVYQGVMFSGFIALALGTLGFIRNEQWRPSSVAFVLGVTAITLQLFAAYVGMLMVLILIIVIVAIVIRSGADISI
jgi:hypothetical protein